MNIKNFEDLKAWQEARVLTNKIYKITANLPFSKDYSLKDQIRRASSSVMLNIAEGFDSGYDQAFIQFLSYAKRSCSEVQSILYISLDNNYISSNDFGFLYEQANVIRKICVGLIKYLKKSKDSHLAARDIKQ